MVLSQTATVPTLHLGLGLWSLFPNPRRSQRAAVIIRQSMAVNFHHLLRQRSILWHLCLFFTSSQTVFLVLVPQGSLADPEQA
jgi:hypothetical protein